LFDRLRRRLRSREGTYALTALALALIAAGGVVGYSLMSRPTVYKVAVAPADGPEARILAAFAQALAEGKRDVRLQLQSFDHVRASGDALAAKRVDLAVVRPDVSLPVNGLTLAILRTEAVIVVAPEAAGIEEMPNLAKKRLGVVTRHDADVPAVTAILAHYDLGPPAVELVPLPPDAIQAALAEKRVDALAFVAVPASREATDVMRAVVGATKGRFRIVPIDEAESISQGMPALSEATIPPGALGGRPRKPDEEVKTVAISYRLMARSDLDRAPVSKAAQYLFQMRSRIARDAPAANLMQAPDVDTSTSATLPNHPGAVDYFNREQLTFMDRYGDWLWMALFFGGSVTSGLAWFARLFFRKRRELVDEVLDRLMCILSEARAAEDVRILDALAVEVDKLVTHAVRYARHRTTGTRTMTSLILAIDSARAAIDDRRRQVERDGPGQAAPRPRRAAIS